MCGPFENPVFVSVKTVKTVIVNRYHNNLLLFTFHFMCIDVYSRDSLLSYPAYRLLALFNPVDNTPANLLQDNRVEHQSVDEVSKPSERVILQQKISAASAWAEFDDDGEGHLVVFGALSNRQASSSTGNSGGPMPGGKNGFGGSSGGVAGKGNKAARVSQVTPIVEAARQRAKTAAEWKRLESQLQKAKASGETVLNKTATELFGSVEEVENDCSLDLLRERMKLLKLAMDDDASQASQQKSRQLYEMCMNDPYLKDLSATILSIEAGCQTMGAASRCRDRLLDLQPNVQKVVELMDNHRNALTVLKTIGTCVQTEADSWKANVLALVKARQDEQKAMRKAAEKEQKAEAQRQARAAAAARRKADAEARRKAKETSVEAAGEGNEDVPPGPAPIPDQDAGKRRTRVARSAELGESDPKILHELRSSNLVQPTTRCDDVASFVAAIALEPDLPCVARLKKGAFKKILSATLPATNCRPTCCPGTLLPPCLPVFGPSACPGV